MFHCERYSAQISCSKFAYEVAREILAGDLSYLDSSKVETLQLASPSSRDLSR